MEYHSTVSGLFINLEIWHGMHGNVILHQTSHHSLQNHEPTNKVLV